MVKPLERRVKHYEEAVVKDIDRPKWHPEKASYMFEVWKDAIAEYAQLEQSVLGILANKNVPRALRGLYLSFARQVYKMVKNKATKREIDGIITMWEARGLNRNVLNEIYKYISGMATGGRR